MNVQNTVAAPDGVMGMFTRWMNGLSPEDAAKVATASRDLAIAKAMGSSERLPNGDLIKDIYTQGEMHGAPSRAEMNVGPSQGAHGGNAPKQIGQYSDPAPQVGMMNTFMEFGRRLGELQAMVKSQGDSIQLLSDSVFTLVKGKQDAAAGGGAATAAAASAKSDPKAGAGAGAQAKAEEEEEEEEKAKAEKIAKAHTEVMKARRNLQKAITKGQITAAKGALMKAKASLDTLVKGDEEEEEEEGKAQAKGDKEGVDIKVEEEEEGKAASAIVSKARSRFDEAKVLIAKAVRIEKADAAGSAAARELAIGAFAKAGGLLVAAAQVAEIPAAEKLAGEMSAFAKANNIAKAEEEEEEEEEKAKGKMSEAPMNQDKRADGHEGSAKAKEQLDTLVKAIDGAMHNMQVLHTNVAGMMDMLTGKGNALTLAASNVKPGTSAPSLEPLFKGDPDASVKGISEKIEAAANSGILEPQEAEGARLILSRVQAAQKGFLGQEVPTQMIRQADPKIASFFKQAA